jgi:hypothetical protein
MSGRSGRSFLDAGDGDRLDERWRRLSRGVV